MRGHFYVDAPAVTPPPTYTVDPGSVTATEVGPRFRGKAPRKLIKPVPAVLIVTENHHARAHCGVSPPAITQPDLDP